MTYEYFGTGSRMLSQDDVKLVQYHGGSAFLSYEDVIAVPLSGSLVCSPIVRRPRPERWWVTEMTRLVDLDDDWDGYGATAPSSRALYVASQFLQQLEPLHDTPKPCVMGSSEGGVLLEWETDDVDLILEFEALGNVNTYVRTPTAEVEGPVEEHVTHVIEALSRL